MIQLQGRVVPLQELSCEDKNQMFELMDLHYEGMTAENFEQDLSRKDCCILLTDERGCIRGFSTQQILNFQAGGREIHGVFSGDTIIHRECWGSPVLFQAFARYFFEYAMQYQHFYWFLISKGYKTYKLLPLFFREFYPDRRRGTPAPIKEIMDHFGAFLYPEEYDKASGVVMYRGKKDTLRPGVADITEGRRKDPDIRFFEEKNPGYLKGYDMVCIADLKRENLRSGMEAHLF